MSGSVNEKSGATFTTVPRDEDGNAFEPTNFRYRLDDLDSGTELIGWTSATPSTEVEVNIPASAHAMVDVNKQVEVKVFTIEFDHDTTVAHTEELEYEVENLHFIT